MEFNEIKAEAICNDLYARGATFEQVDYLSRNLTDQDFDEMYDFSELERAYNAGDFANGYTPDPSGLSISTSPTPVIVAGVGTGLATGVSTGLLLNNKGTHHPIIGGAITGAATGTVAGVVANHIQKNKAAQQLGYASYKDLKAARSEAMRAGNFAVETPGLKANQHPITVNAAAAVGTLGGSLGTGYLTRKIKNPIHASIANTAGGIAAGSAAKFAAQAIDNNQAAKKLGFQSYSDYKKFHKDSLINSESKQRLVNHRDFSLNQILNTDYTGRDFSTRALEAKVTYNTGLQPKTPRISKRANADEYQAKAMEIVEKDYGVKRPS